MKSSLKCHLSASPFSGKLKGSNSVGAPDLVLILFFTFLSLFIDYIKTLWKYEMSKWCSKWAVTECCRENLLLPRTGGFLWVCNFPTLIAEGLIKYFRNVSPLFYLLRGKVMLTSLSCPPQTISVIFKEAKWCYLIVSTFITHTRMPNNSNCLSLFSFANGSVAGRGRLIAGVKYK